MKKVIMAVSLAFLVAWGVTPVLGMTLTSLTMEKSTNTGGWTNAPGGIWSTNLSDTLSQLGVRQNGTFLNTPVGAIDLGEIAITLSAGINTFELFGNSWGRGGNDYYGLALFFDGKATPPAMAVYNSINSSGLFSVTEAGTIIAGSANGGSMPDVAPGLSIFSASDGSTVELIGFNVFYSDSNSDVIGWGNIGPDGYVDTYAVLQLDYTPTPEPATVLLFGSGLISLAGLRKRMRKEK